MVSKRRERCVVGDAGARAEARARAGTGGVLAALAVGIPLLAAAPVDAQMLCSEPLKPLCSTAVQSFTDATEKERCVADTDKYLEELDAYRGCLSDALAEAEQARERAEDFRTCLQESDGNDCGLDTD